MKHLLKFNPSFAGRSHNLKTDPGFFIVSAFRLLLLTGLALTFVLINASCGTSSNSNNNVSGNWTATLTGTNGSQNFGFTLQMFQNSDNSVSVTNLRFNNSTPCFTEGNTTASGGFALSGDFNGNTSGSLALLVQSNTSANTLTMNGTLRNNSISGTWTLTGNSGCSGSGSFTMVR